MQLPGFEPGPRTWQARIITKLYYNCSIDQVEFSLLNCNEKYYFAAIFLEVP